MVSVLRSICLISWFRIWILLKVPRSTLRGALELLEQARRELARGDLRQASVFRQADSMHKNFYENLATREDVEDALREVERLVNEIVRILRREHDR